MRSKADVRAIILYLINFDLLEINLKKYHYQLQDEGIPSHFERLHIQFHYHRQKPIPHQAQISRS